MDENGPDHVLESRLAQLYVPAGEEHVDRRGDLLADGVLGVVQTL